ncbi:MAG: copper homeostasis protein CutC [Planctomycetaceae bacterium]
MDGLTPSAGLVKSVLDQVNIPVVAMVRPRAGDFCYESGEWQTMIRSAQWLLETGVHGLAFGAVTADGKVDRERCRQMRALVGQRDLVFHKAFDCLADWSTSSRHLIDLGIDRVMTSGRADGCPAGLAAMRELLDETAGQLTILPAGGISAANVVDVVRTLGVEQVHGSFSGGNPRNYRFMGREIESTLANLRSYFNRED